MFMLGELAVKEKTSKEPGMSCSLPGATVWVLGLPTHISRVQTSNYIFLL